MPSIKIPKGATPALVTQLHMDQTHVLETMLRGLRKGGKESDGESSLLGEFQLSFVVFLIGQNLHGFEHWKELVRVFCSCEEAIETRATLFQGFVGTCCFFPS